MNILNKQKLNRVLLGLGVGAAVSLFWCRAATAEVTLFEANGWSFTFGGRVNAFLSGGKGDNFPQQTPDPTGATHLVMGQNATGPGAGVADVGWLTYQGDANNKYTGVRVRSGMFPNVLGFGLQRNLSERTTIRGYVSIWATVETLGRDKWAPVTAEAREGYFTINNGTWGSLTVGRTLGWLGRTSYEIDSAYGHGYGLGLPCTDALGPACGHIGTGALFPGYSAGVSYSTPSAGGLQLHAALYDPIVFTPSTSSDWSRASFVRPEGALTFDTAIAGTAKLKIGVEGLYQTVQRTGIDTAGTPANVDASIWGVSGGARVEFGPVRVGASGFRGRGIGLGYAGQRSVAIADDDASAMGAGGLSYKLRTFTGIYGQVAVVSGPIHVAAGYGQGIVDQLAEDKVNPNLSVIHSQTGISASFYYHVNDAVVLGLDFFRFQASWYGAPRVDANGQATGAKLPGELQQLNFLNAGATYHW